MLKQPTLRLIVTVAATGSLFFTSNTGWSQNAQVVVGGNSNIRDTITANALNVSGQTKFDNLQVSNKITTSRITSPDSLIHFGDSTLLININKAVIYNDELSDIKGVAIGGEKSIGVPSGSVAIGNNAVVFPGAYNAIAIGSGSATTAFLNMTPNSLAVGFNSNIPTLFVESATGTGTTGNVGIGTTTPSQKLEVAHNDLNGGIALNRLSGTTAKSEIKFNQNGIQKWAIGNDFGSNGTSDFFIWDHAAQATRFFISPAGSIGIGTTTPNPNCKVSIETSTTIGLCSKTNHSAPYGYNILAIANNTRTKAIAVVDQNGTDQFFVYGDGLVAACEFKVTVGQFPPDYVFGDDYLLMPINEYRRRIKKGRHFPEMLSGKEMLQEGSVGIGDFQFRLLKIQEHQILYTFNHEDRIAELEKQNAEKDKKIAALEKKMDELLNGKKSISKKNRK